MGVGSQATRNQSQPNLLVHDESLDISNQSISDKKTEPFDPKKALSRYSKVTQEEIRAREDWGKNMDGYVAGGSYEDNPKLKKFTVKTYQQMKGLGQLGRASNIDDVSHYESQFMQDRLNSQS